MALAICLQKKGLHPFECFWLSDGKNCHPPFKQLKLDQFKKIVIRSNSSGYPFQTIVSHATVPNHFTRAVCDEPDKKLCE